MNLHSIQPIIPDLFRQCAMLIETLYPNGYEFMIHDRMLFERARASTNNDWDEDHWEESNTEYWQRCVREGDLHWVETTNVRWVNP